jgi:alkanesulfonate monooxygenase SsuD/methylene tetrahydromethanopterin reductase-like flavin-dependent oxidoreductase (luciferase family)
MAISTLGELTQGRVILNVSVGNILNLSESGVEPTKPIKVMRDYVEAVRALWAGKPVTHEGELHKLRGAKMVFDQGRQYPIYVASTGPQMLKLAGEISDGVLLSAGLTLASTRRCLELASVGMQAKKRDPRSCGTVLSSTSTYRRTGQGHERQCCASLPSCFGAAATPTISSHPTLISTTRRSWLRMPVTILTEP